MHGNSGTMERDFTMHGRDLRKDFVEIVCQLGMEDADCTPVDDSEGKSP